MNKTERMAVRVTPELKKALEETAAKEERTVSQVALTAIKRYLEGAK